MNAAGAAQPEPLTPPANGPKRVEPGFHALINATVHIGPNHTIEHATVVMPGYTHGQHAQPITFGYWLLSAADVLAQAIGRGVCPD